MVRYGMFWAVWLPCLYLTSTSGQSVVSDLSTFAPVIPAVPVTSPGKRIPITEVWALAKSVAELPCDVSTTDPQDQVRLVLWYREDLGTPIYSVDVRDAGFHMAESWSDDHVFGPRATFRVATPMGGQGALLITNIKPRDEGIFRCRVDFRMAQTRNVRVNLTVVVPPRRPVVLNEEGVALGSTAIAGPVGVGEDLRLTCEVAGGRPPPRVVWSREGNVLDDSSYVIVEGVVRNDLTLVSLTRADLGAQITCTASNSNLTQPVSATVTVDMILKPLDVRLVGADTPLSAGKPATLTCLTRGSRPPPLVAWLRDGHLMAEAPALGGEGGNETSWGVLQWTPGLEDAGRVITCRVRNPLWIPGHTHESIEEAALEDSRTLAIQYRPRVQLQLGSNLQGDNIKEGEDVYFDCQAYANPPVTKIEWIHNDKKLLHNVSGGVIVSNQSLVLQRVSRLSAGKYRCIAYNREGDTESAGLLLDVKFAPVCKSGQPKVYGVARLEEARIVCEVESNPVKGLVFRWALNASAGLAELTPGSYTAEGSRSVANYLPTTDLDFGAVLCWASNSVGPQAQPCVFHVIPAEKPDPVSNCSVSHQSTDSLLLSCLEGFSGGLPQFFFLQVFSPSAETGSGGEVLHANMTSAKPSFLVRSLQPDTQYEARMYAVNAKGHSALTTWRLMTLRPPETQKNTELADRNRPTSQTAGGSSLLAFTPILAIVVGAFSALILLALLLVLALKLRCRRQRRMGLRLRSTGCHSHSLSTDMTQAGCSETMLMVKADQRSHTPASSAGGGSVLGHASTVLLDDERNPDLIPPREEELLMQGRAPPLAALLADLPPHYRRQLSSLPGESGPGGLLLSHPLAPAHHAPYVGPALAMGDSATLGRKTRWKPEYEPGLAHLSATLPRMPHWTTPLSSASNVTPGSPTITPKKESSV